MLIISTKIYSFFTAGILALLTVAQCKADLFAVVSSSPEILRINSATGAVTDTYPFPDWLPMIPTSTLGLAFDGRTLYMNRRSAFGGDELWILDVVTEIWYPPAPIYPIPFPPGQTQLLTGMGFRSDGFGGGTLIAVTRNIADAPPSYILQFLMPPGFPEPLQINIGAGDLPPGLAAQGADVDPATGELWIAVDEREGNLILGRHLLRSDLDGTVLEMITPALDPPTLIRGVGFDAGAMFIAGRSLPAQTNNVFEIDRATGAVLRSFPLPGTGIVGALTGGEVLPEPNGLMLIARALGGIAASRRTRGPSISDR